MQIASGLPVKPRVFIMDDPSPNAFAVGSVVRVYVSDRPQPLVRWHQPTTGYASQNQPIVHFGLGAETSIVVVSKILVKWFKGKDLALPRLPRSQNPEVVVRLSNSAGECWESRF